MVGDNSVRSMTFSFLILVTTDSLQSHPDVLAVLCHPGGAYGPELRLRNADDRVADVHETSFAVFDQRSRCPIETSGF
jgi:hypothetical protein